MMDSHVAIAPRGRARAAWALPCAVALMAAFAAGAARTQDNGAEPYKVVTEKNIFRKLGWSPPNETPQYTVVLIATASPPEPEARPEADAEADFWAGILGAPPEPDEPAEAVEPRKSRALISRNGSNETFYVEPGQKVQDLTVVSIEPGKVKLSGEDGSEMELAMGEGGFGGGGGGPRGGGRRGRQGPRGPGGPGGPDQGRFGGQMPGQAREMMEGFRNASPEERQQMRAEFRGGRGGRGRGR